MSQLETIQGILNTYQDGKVMFDECIRVRLAPHQTPFNVWGAWRVPEGVYLMDGEEHWHGPLLEGQMNATQVIASVYQRLKQLSYASGITN